jgi:hypothetical protein
MTTLASKGFKKLLLFSSPPPKGNLIAEIKK